MLWCGYSLIATDQKYVMLFGENLDEFNRLKEVERQTIGKWFVNQDPSTLMLRFIKDNPKAIDNLYVKYTPEFGIPYNAFDFKGFIEQFQVWLSLQFEVTNITKEDIEKRNGEFKEAANVIIEGFKQVDTQII